MSRLRVTYENRQLDPYELLKLPFPCTHDQLEKQFRRKALRFHPDKDGSATAREAYALLTTCKEAVKGDIVELRTTSFGGMQQNAREMRAETHPQAKGVPANFFANSDALVYRENPFDQSAEIAADVRANREDVSVRRLFEKYDAEEVAQIFEYNRVKNNRQIVQREIVPFNMTQKTQGTLLAPSSSSVTRAQSQGYGGLSRLQDAYIEVEYGRLKPQAPPTHSEKARLAELERDVDCGPRRAWDAGGYDNTIVQRLMDDNARNEAYVAEYNRRYLRN